MKERKKESINQINMEEPNQDEPKQKSCKKNTQKQTRTYEQKQEKKHKKSQEKKSAANYCKKMRSHLMVTVYNEKTRQESEEYRNRKMPNGAAIYCSPLPVATTIPQEENMMVLEMNNDTNQIMAVGLVQNRPHIEKYAVYKDTNESYNRFVYMGKYRIKREDMTKEEEQIMKSFDNLCFKGNYHMKRGQGIRAFPAVILWRCRIVVNLVEFVENMFRKRLHKTNTEKINT
jgi:hypothetical protein